MQPKEPVWLYGDVAAGNTVRKEHTFNQDSTITDLWARNYIGHGFDLQYHYKIKDSEGKTRNLIQHLDKEFVSGDGDIHDPTIRQEVKEGETLIVEVVNNTSEYAYHYNTYVVVDKEGNTIDSLANRIGGILGGIS
jgi:hypothetical protein